MDYGAFTDLRKAFDSEDFQVMIVANKFQTGFDQRKLCAMYVDKKLGGVDCVQTLSRLNRIYPGKAVHGTFVLDFFNDPEDILEAFKPYYQTAELEGVSDPNLIFDLKEKLCSMQIFVWHEVGQFAEAYLKKSKSSAALTNICKPAVDRWTIRYKSALEAQKVAAEMLRECKKENDNTAIKNAEKSVREAKEERDSLEVFKKDLGTFVRFYEFMSQIVEYDDIELEQLSLYARNLRFLLKEEKSSGDVSLNGIELSHYRLSKIKEQDIEIKETKKLRPGSDLGSGKGRDRKEEFLSQIIDRLNELFVTDNLTDKDLVNYAFTIRDKISENETVMNQIKHNTPDQAMLGDFNKAVDEAVMDSEEAHRNQMEQILSDPDRAKKFARVVFDLLMFNGNK